MGKLYFYYGTMGASKSAEALICKHRYEEESKKVLLCKSKQATRDGECVIKSRIGLYSKAVVLEDLFQNINLQEIGHIIKLYDVIIVDEVQFCSEDTINLLSDITDTYDIPIICYGLKTSHNTKLFEGSKRLIEIADKVSEIKNICNCGRKALFNIKLDGDDINGNYVACCRKCAKKYIRKDK